MMHFPCEHTVFWAKCFVKEGPKNIINCNQQLHRLWTMVTVEENEGENDVASYLVVQSIYYSGTSKIYVPFLPTWLVLLLLRCSNANIWLWFVSVEVNYKVEPSARLASSADWRYWFLNFNVWKLAWLPSWVIFHILCPFLNNVLSRVRGSVTNKTSSRFDDLIYWCLLFFYNQLQ
jgi:hypothetical protein